MAWRLGALSCLMLLGSAAAGSVADSAGNATAQGGGAAQAAASMQSATQRLFNTLLVTFAAVFLGYGCVRFKFVVPDEGQMRGFGFFVGQIVFPMLIFRTVATAQLRETNMGVLLACNIGKWVCSSIMFAGGYFTTSGAVGEKILTGTVFAAFVIASNDFAIGFPVVEALYGHKANMGIYIAGNSLFGSLINVPALMVLFSLGQSLQKKASRSDAVPDDQLEDLPEEEEEVSEGHVRQCLVIIKDIILNPVITMTIAGLVYKAVFGWTLTADGNALKFPHPLQDLIELVTSPFGMSALFLTGTSMQAPRVSVTSVVLVAMKVVVCAFVSYAACVVMVRAVPLWNFSFLYGMIPTSSAPLVFAIQFAPDHAEAVATAILLGLIAGGPMMYVAALFLEAAYLDMASVVSDVQLSTSAAALLCGGAFFVLVALAMLRGVLRGAGAQELLIVGHAAALFAEEVLMVHMNPRLGDADCSAFNAEQARSALGRSIGWLQSSSHLVLLSLQVSRCLGGSTSIVRGALVLAGCFALGVAPALLTVPNTVSEICSTVAPPLGGLNLLPNAVWVLALFVATAALYGPARRCQPAKPASGETCAGLVDGLAAFAVVRYFMQVVNTVQVMFGEDVMGAFAQMLVLENILEHSQLLVLFFLAITNTSFTAIVASAVACWSRRAHAAAGLSGFFMDGRTTPRRQGTSEGPAAPTSEGDAGREPALREGA